MRDDPLTAARLKFALTRAELGVLGLLMQGRSNQEIALHRFISPKTVQTHLKHIYRKLGVASRLQAVLAVMNG